jgi:hypothetical protein
MENNQKDPLDWFDNLSAFLKGLTKFEEDDSTFMLGLKIVLRFVLVIIMIILSPVLLLGLAIAFAAVL